ncbi:MAG TPA: DUF1800 domain-containing protein [Pirellulales bacterium]|nr:DUF1800 domain-containing protein [Pirellulales bacterium]
MHWQPYTPDDKTPWNVRRVIHLHRRAGFAATWDEIERDLKDGPQTTIDRLLAGKAYSTAVPEDFEATSRLLADAAVGSGNIQRLKAWWLFRMMYSPDPLGERLALLWHNHFATSYRKVQDVAMMRRQNDLFRQFGRAPFAELLGPVVKDPAMLLWLDADSNRRAHPNENLARELMELFTLGVGNYGETDVQEAARALTGWTVKNREFRELPAYHDNGEKTVLGRRGNWRGDDLIALLIDQPATALRLAKRLCELLMGEATVEQPALDELAECLRSTQLHIGSAVETVLRSSAFFDDKNLGRRVLGPAEYLIGAVRALEALDPPPTTMVLAEWMALLGQDLFEPPNVFGWAGGRTWINSRSLVARGNFARRLADGGLQNPAATIGWVALAQRHGCGENADAFAGLLAKLLWGAETSDEARQIKQRVLGDDTALTPENSRRLVAALLGSPAAQLG